MARTRFLAGAALWATALLCTGDLFAQGAKQAGPGKAAARPAAAAKGSLVFEVHAVVGRVSVSPSGTDPKLKAGWTRPRVGDFLHAGQQIRTGLRSKIRLVARPETPPTVLMVESGSLINIEELALKKGIAKSRLDLGYGAVRAGVAEAEVRSDMQITCPVATLSKKGTDIFRMEYANGRFRVSLSERGRGLLQAWQLKFNTKGGLLGVRSRFVTPGQFVTQRMTLAIENVQFDREININDLFGLVGNDRLFTLLNDRGLGFLLPQGGNIVNVLGSTFGPDAPGISDPGGQGDPLNLFLPRGPAVRSTREGDFGIGQGLIPSVLHGAAKRRQLENLRRCRKDGHGICRRLGR